MINGSVAVIYAYIVLVVKRDIQNHSYLEFAQRITTTLSPFAYQSFEVLQFFLLVEGASFSGRVKNLNTIIAC